MLGRIPSGRLYQPGLNILKLYPLPTLTGAAAAGLNYNYEVTRPVENTTGLQPAIRLDYQPTLGAAGNVQVLGLAPAEPGLQRSDSRASTTPSSTAR